MEKSIIEGIEDVKFSPIKTKFISYKFNLSFSIPRNTEFTISGGYKNKTVSYKDCIFSKDLSIDSINVRTGQDGRKLETISITFEDCHFYGDILAEKSVLDCKVRFRNCHFHEEVNFRNTTFNDLAEFSGCTFHQPITFYKTNFKELVIFSATTFKENVLFTYALIEKLLILRGTKPEKGFDLSLAIISGELSLFDFQLNDYDSYDNILEDVEKETLSKTEYSNVYEVIYETAVSKNHKIPLKNKRETYRILKHQLESQNDFSESIRYKVLEKKAMRKELRLKKHKIDVNEKFNQKWKKIWQNIGLRLDSFNLNLNKFSNNYGSSYGKALLFVALIGGLFFYLSIISTERYYATLNPSQWELSKGAEYFFQFLIPTHKFDYLNLKEELTGWFYFFDFMGRILVGYGIYQFIQAFRKFR